MAAIFNVAASSMDIACRVLALAPTDNTTRIDCFDPECTDCKLGVVVAENLVCTGSSTRRQVDSISNLGVASIAVDEWVYG